MYLYKTKQTQTKNILKILKKFYDFSTNPEALAVICMCRK